MTMTVGKIRQVSSSSFEWKIENFASLLAETGDYFQSPSFKVGTDIWCLVMIQNNCSEGDNSYMSMCLKKLNVQEPNMTVLLKTSVEYTKKCFSASYEGKIESCENGSLWGWDRFVTRSQLMKEIDTDPPSDVLTVVCTIHCMSSEVHYNENQWSPSNPEGKKQYDRMFLLGLQTCPLSLRKPPNLPKLNIIKDKAHIQRMLRVIDVTPTLQPLDFTNLHDVGNAGKSDETDDSEGTVEIMKMSKKVSRILDKVNQQKSKTSAKQLSGLRLDTEEKLNIVFDLVFAAAVQESYCFPYADLMRKLANIRTPLAGQPERFINFTELFLAKCQDEFEKSREFKREERTKSVATAETMTEDLNLKFEDREQEALHRQLGTIRFIGELFNVDMLTEPIMHQYVETLTADDNEGSLESLCLLLKIIGKKLDKKFKHKKTDNSFVDIFFARMQPIADRHCASSIGHLLQEVIDLRKNNWIPKAEEDDSKTTDPVREDAKLDVKE